MSPMDMADFPHMTAQRWQEEVGYGSCAGRVEIFQP